MDFSVVARDLMLGVGMSVSPGGVGWVGGGVVALGGRAGGASSSWGSWTGRGEGGEGAEGEEL